MKTNAFQQFDAVWYYIVLLDNCSLIFSLISVVIPKGTTNYKGNPKGKQIAINPNVFRALRVLS